MSHGRDAQLRRLVAGAIDAGFDVTIVRVGTLPALAASALDAVAAGYDVELQDCAPYGPPVEPAHMRPTIALFRHLRAQPFDAILIQDREGLAYASITAKESGLAFGETVLGVLAFGTSRQERESNHRFPAGLVTIATEHLEQRALELADVVVLAEQSAGWMQQAGWRLGPTLPWPESSDDMSSERSGWASVFGRLRSEEHHRTVSHGDDTRANDVTVVITHFEQPKLLEQNLVSLTRQTDRNFSVLVVDDGSRSEDAISCLAGLEEQYRTLDLRLLRQENRYLGAARNAGIRAADTECVLLLDDDNVAYPDLVKALRRAIRASRADVVTCGISHFHDATGAPHAGMDRSGPDQFFSAGPVLLGAIHNCFGDASGIYRKAIFDEVGYFHELRGVTFEDWQMHLRVVTAGFRLLSLPEPLVWYRVRPTSMLRATRRYDNARVIASTIDELPCSLLAPLADYLMGSEEDQVRLNGELQALQAVAAASATALLEAKTEAERHARGLEEILEERTKSERSAERYARSLEETVAALRDSLRAATEYAVGLERSRAETEAYAKSLETELGKYR